MTNEISFDQRMIKTAGTLFSLGYDVEIVGRTKKNAPPLSQAPYKQTRIPCFFEKGKLFYIEYNLRLFFYLHKINFQLIIAVDLDTIIPAYYAGKFKKAILYYDAHEYFPEMPEVERRKVIKWIWQKIEAHFVPCFDYCYTVSKSIQTILSEKYSKPFALIRNVPKLKLIQPQTEKSLYILYQGALNEGRGLEALLHSIVVMPNVYLKLAGEGDKSEYLRALARRLNIENRVEFLGFVSPEQLKEITCKAYIGVNLLENRGLNYYYSLANKFFDYIMAGIPSINMDFPEYRAIQETYHCTYLIENLEIDTIKRAITDFYEDQILYQNLQDNCLKARVQLNWENESEIFKTTLNF